MMTDPLPPVHQVSETNNPDRPRYYLLGERLGWELVAAYVDEDVVEEVFDTREKAEYWLPRVRQARMNSGQNEIPRFVIEDHR